MSSIPGSVFSTSSVQNNQSSDPNKQANTANPSISFDKVLNNYQDNASAAVNTKPGKYKKLDIFEKAVLEAFQDKKITSDQKDQFLAGIQGLKDKFHHNIHAHGHHAHHVHGHHGGHHGKAIDCDQDEDTTPQDPEAAVLAPSFLDEETAKTTHLENFIASSSALSSVSQEKLQHMKDGLQARKEFISMVGQFKSIVAPNASQSPSPETMRSSLVGNINKLSQNAISPNDIEAPQELSLSPEPESGSSTSTLSSTSEEASSSVDFSLNTSVSDVASEV